MARRRKLTPGKLLVRIIQYGSLVIASIAVLLPLWSTIAGSFKTPVEYINTSHSAPPPPLIGSSAKMIEPTVKTAKPRL